jgi:hypothetical protein
LSYLPITIRAHNHTVVCSLASLFYWHDRDGMHHDVLSGDNLPEASTTSCTSSSKPIGRGLSKKSFRCSSSRKLHSNSPPLAEWREFAVEDYWYFVNGEWTGIIINTISRLWVSFERWINLKYPVYHISFCPNADTKNVYDLVAIPMLREAKKLAEEYYKQWLSVNHNFDTHTKNLYSLVKTLEGRASGSNINEDANGLRI